MPRPRVLCVIGRPSPGTLSCLMYSRLTQESVWAPMNFCPYYSLLPIQTQPCLNICVLWPTCSDTSFYLYLSFGSIVYHVPWAFFLLLIIIINACPTPGQTLAPRVCTLVLFSLCSYWDARGAHLCTTTPELISGATTNCKCVGSCSYHAEIIIVVLIMDNVSRSLLPPPELALL